MMNSIVRYQRTIRQQEECDSAIGRAVRFCSRSVSQVCRSNEGRWTSGGIQPNKFLNNKCSEHIS